MPLRRNELGSIDSELTRAGVNADTFSQTTSTPTLALLMDSSANQPQTTVAAAELLERARYARNAITSQVGRRVFGQEEVIEHLLIALFARGHTLMMGVPGLAKTLLVSTLAQILDLNFNRIQFTPDLMPADITGTDIIEEDPETGRRRFTFIPGPIFANLLLADEINRTPPKTQAALLQAMAEQHVTVGGRTYPIESPFLVFATQNPIEQEGTYPLPEAQLDRFMFHVRVEYPSLQDELRIGRLTTSDMQEPLKTVMSPADILEMQRLVRHVEVSDAVSEFAVRLVRATRPGDDTASAEIKRFVQFGAGPRATQFLILGAKARAILSGYETPSIDDIRALAPSVLRHRILVNFMADSDGITSDDLVTQLIRKAGAA
jgi:MoxR-like ATPase